MSREIMFRAKRKDTNEWVYGGLDIQPGDTVIFDCSEPWHSQIEVDEKTVGQLTGIKDKNSKSIFEGDIVKVNTEGWFEDETIIEIVGEVIYMEAAFQVWSEGETYPLFNCCGSKVIGNIHDNPELLVVKND